MSKNNKHEDLGHMCLSMLKDRYVVSKEIIGTDEYKKAKGKANRFNQAAADYFSAFLDQVGAMPACDPLTKEKRAGAFASRLLEEGGPAVDQVKKLFGAEFAHRLVLNYMYGVGSAYAVDWQ